MNQGDRVKIRENFHRPTRVGQFAKIITSRGVGEKESLKAMQHFIMYESDGLPDWINEYDLELVEENREYDEYLASLQNKESNVVPESHTAVNAEGRRVLIL